MEDDLVGMMTERPSDSELICIFIESDWVNGDQNSSSDLKSDRSILLWYDDIKGRVKVYH